MANPPSEERDGAPLTARLQGAIAKHLNDDHLEEMLICAKANADVDWAEEVKVLGVDALGVDLEVKGGDRLQSLRLTFPESAKGVLGLRRTLEKTIAESRDKIKASTEFQE
ncbi:MAG: DUF2470 domain-containing protein [Cyanobacteria bacterium P01_E01_bin.42]